MLRRLGNAASVFLYIIDKHEMAVFYLVLLAILASSAPVLLAVF